LKVAHVQYHGMVYEMPDNRDYFCQYLFNTIVNPRDIDNIIERVQPAINKIIGDFRHSGNHSVILTILLSRVVFTIILNVCGLHA